MHEQAPVIRVVRKKHHEEHHGGAWKVAYADFVTAMMAFFLVMWIVSMNDEAKDSVQAYFNDPMGYQEALAGTAGAIGSPIALTGNNSIVELLNQRHVAERNRLEGVAEELRESLGGIADSEAVAAAVAVEVTQDGLRIELVENGDRESTFFQVSSAALTPAAERVLALIAEELEVQANDVIVEGHTDSNPLNRADYTNWELSNDRANAARRQLERAGLDPTRVKEVRGYADRRLALPETPTDPANRRVSILLPFINQAPPEDYSEPGAELDSGA